MTSEWKPTKPENPDFKCYHCGSDDVWYYEWESSDGAFEDTRYKCRGCGQKWWVEGADA